MNVNNKTCLLFYEKSNGKDISLSDKHKDPACCSIFSENHSDNFADRNDRKKHR